MYQYAATCERVVDGDTLDLMMDLGCKVFLRERVRLYGLNTPELHSSDPVERAAAQKAKLRLESLVGGKKLRIDTFKDKQEKYGRYLANVYVLGDTLLPPLAVPILVNKILLDEGLGQPYDGGKR